MQNQFHMGRTIVQSHSLLTKEQCKNNQRIIKCETGDLPPSIIFTDESNGNGGTMCVTHITRQPGDNFNHDDYPQAQ